MIAFRVNVVYSSTVMKNKIVRISEKVMEMSNIWKYLEI